jgi:serine/threonine-protein kinase
MGTIAYMSPEQARGEEVDHHTDIWALGVVLYEMITGQAPFKGEYEQAVVYSILNEAPKPIAEFTTGALAKLQRIVERAIAKNLHERYQHMSEILADLSALKKELESEATRKSISEEKPAPSIAVLPFVDMSPQRDQEYFCDGISEELLDALTKVGGLQVVSRTSSFAFKGKEQDIRKIGEQLNVTTILEGSVRKAGNRLRITAQLINVADGFHLWSEKYDREMKDIFDIQEEISRAIVEALKIKLVGEPAKHLVKRYTENLEAYNLYLKGRYFWNKRFEGGLQQAMEHFKQVIEKEPAYALAHVGLADCFIILGWFAYLAPKDAFTKAKAAVQKALEIDDRLAEAHASLGFIKFASDWDWLEAEQEFRRSIALNPNYATVHWWYAFSLVLWGRTEESLAEIKRAYELDPLSLIINTGVGLILYFAGQYDQAVGQCLKTLELDPNFGAARAYLGRALAQKSRYEEAIAEGQKALKLLGPSFIGSWLGHTYAIAGKKDEARKLLNEMNELSKQRYVSPYQMAPIHLGIGEIDQAFALLEMAYEKRDCYLCALKVDPLFDSLRADPRFIELLKKVGLEK